MLINFINGERTNQYCNMEVLEKKQVKKESPTIWRKLPLDDKGNLIKNEYSIIGPRNLVEVSFPKSGKSLTKADVPHMLVGDAEGGTDDFKMSNRVNLLTYEGDKEFVKISAGYVHAGIFQTVDELNRANGMKKYWEIKNKFDDARTGEDKKILHGELVSCIKSMKFPIFCMDTITSVQDINNATALYEYNLGVKAENRKGNIKKADDFSGVRYTRAAFNVLKDFVEMNAAPFIIWSGHVASRKKVFKKGEEDISAVDIALDGLYSTIFTAKAQAVSIFYRNDKGCFLDFTKKEETDLGSRTPNLSNQVIKIADLLSDEEIKAYKRPKTYWDIIYPEVFS